MTEPCVTDPCYICGLSQDDPECWCIPADEIYMRFAPKVHYKTTGWEKVQTVLLVVSVPLAVVAANVYLRVMA